MNFGITNGQVATGLDTYVYFNKGKDWRDVVKKYYELYPEYNQPGKDDGPCTIMDAWPPADWQFQYWREHNVRSTQYWSYYVSGTNPVDGIMQAGGYDPTASEWTIGRYSGFTCSFPILKDLTTRANSYNIKIYAYISLQIQKKVFLDAYKPSWWSAQIKDETGASYDYGISNYDGFSLDPRDNFIQDVSSEFCSVIQKSGFNGFLFDAAHWSGTFDAAHSSPAGIYTSYNNKPTDSILRQDLLGWNYMRNYFDTHGLTNTDIILNTWDSAKSPFTVAEWHDNYMTDIPNRSYSHAKMFFAKKPFGFFGLWDEGNVTDQSLRLRFTSQALLWNSFYNYEKLRMSIEGYSWVDPASIGFLSDEGFAQGTAGDMIVFFRHHPKLVIPWWYCSEHAIAEWIPGSDNITITGVTVPLCKWNDNVSSLWYNVFSLGDGDYDIRLWNNSASNQNITVAFNTSQLGMSGSYECWDVFSGVTGTYTSSQLNTGVSVSGLLPNESRILVFRKRPDLSVASGEITVSNANPKPGDNVTISAVIRNIGSGSTAETLGVNRQIDVKFFDMQNSQNLALNKTVTADKEDGGAASYAVDGVVTYKTGNKWCATGPAPHWLEVDLGAVYSIKRFVVAHAGAGGEPFCYSTADYKIQSRLTTGDSWTDQVTVASNFQARAIHDITPCSARYVRLYITRPTRFTDTTARIYEFEVFESAGIEIASLELPSNPIGNVPRFPAGASTNVSVDYTFSTPGTHAIYVSVDPYNFILESDKTNNLAVTNVVVLDSPGSFRFSSPSYGVAQDAGTMSIQVVRAYGTNGAAMVDYATSDGTGAAGVNYTSASGTLSFANGETSKTFSITILNQAVGGSGKTVNLALSNPTGGATLGTPSTSVLTIVPPGPFSIWSYKMNIQFPGYTSASGQTLTNFPVLLVFTNNMGGVFNYSQALPAGDDLRFSDCTNVVALNFEIEKWVTNGSSYVWVQVPVMSNNCSIWAFWGKSDATPAACTTNGATWDSSFRGVWHLGEASGTSHFDSTSNRNASTTSGTTTMGAAGAVDGAAGYSGAAYDTINNSGSLNVTAGITFGGWAQYATAASGDKAPFFIKGDNEGANDFGFIYTVNNGTFWLCLNNGATSINFGPSLNTWYYIMGTYDQTTVRAYVNGRQVASWAYSSAINNSYASACRIGGGTWGKLNGRVDECRVMLTAVSSNWIWTSYLNMTSNDTFCCYTNNTSASGNAPLGTPISWLVSHGLTGDPAAAELSDPNGDRVPVWQDYILGANPSGSNNGLKGTITRTANGLVITFPGPSASGSDYSGKTRHYKLEGTMSLIAPSWQAILNYSNITGNDIPLVYTNAVPGLMNYYRTRAWLQ